MKKIIIIVMLLVMPLGANESAELMQKAVDWLEKNPEVKRQVEDALNAKEIYAQKKEYSNYQKNMSMLLAVERYTVALYPFLLKNYRDFSHIGSKKYQVYLDVAELRPEFEALDVFLSDLLSDQKTSAAIDLAKLPRFLTKKPNKPQTTDSPTAGVKKSAHTLAIFLKEHPSLFRALKKVLHSGLVALLEDSDSNAYFPEVLTPHYAIKSTTVNVELLLNELVQEYITHNWRGGDCYESLQAEETQKRAKEIKNLEKILTANAKEALTQMIKTVIHELYENPLSKYRGSKLYDLINDEYLLTKLEEIAK